MQVVYSVRNDPIITPKRKNPGKELESFLSDIEEMMRDLKMVTPLEKTIAYVVSYDSLMQLGIGKGCPCACIMVNEMNIAVMMNTSLWKKHFKKINPERLANQKVVFEEWLHLRIDLRGEDFSYFEAMCKIQQKLQAVIKDDDDLIKFKKLSDHLHELATRKGN